VVHPFHPLTGQELELVSFGHTWGDQKVFYRKPDDEGVYSMLATWTDVEPVHAFVALSAGRAHCRTEDLLALATLVRETLEHRVRQITP